MSGKTDHGDYGSAEKVGERDLKRATLSEKDKIGYKELTNVLECVFQGQMIPNSVWTYSFTCRFLLFFFIWMLHGSTKVVVRAVALLSANTKDKVAMSLSKL